MEELEHMCVHSCMYVCVHFAQLGVCDWSEVCLKSSSVALMYQYVKGSNGKGQEAMWRRTGLCVRETLHEQQLLGSLSALAEAGTPRSGPCSHALSVCLHVWEWMSECVFALKREMLKEALSSRVTLKCSWNKQRLKRLDAATFCVHVNEY